VESWNRSQGCRVEFSISEKAGKGCTVTIDDKGKGDDHLEGILEPLKTLHLPSGRKVLHFNWNPPPDKKEGCSGEDKGRIGYSDVWDFVKSKEMGPPEVTVEGTVNDSVWKERFPLSAYLFENDDDDDDEEDNQANQARAELPTEGIILLVHWWGISQEQFGVKEFLYLCRPGESAQQAERVLAKHGAYATCVCNF